MAKYPQKGVALSFNNRHFYFPKFAYNLGAVFEVCETTVKKLLSYMV